MSITVDSIDVAKVTRDVETLLVNAPLVGGSGVGIDRSEPEPTDPPINGWVGIYCVGQVLPSVIAGAGQAGRNHQIELVFAIVQTDLTGGAECTDRLNALLKNVIDTLLNDSSLGGNVTFISDVRIQYSDYAKSNSQYRQTAYLFITGIKRV